MLTSSRLLFFLAAESSKPEQSLDSEITWLLCFFFSGRIVIDKKTHLIPVLVINRQMCVNSAGAKILREAESVYSEAKQSPIVG